MNGQPYSEESSRVNLVSRIIPQGLWLGPLMVLAGALSYFLVFARYPFLRDFPWLNLPVVLVGVVWSGWAAWLNLRAAPGMVRKVFGLAGCLVGWAIAFMFGWYVFYYSYQMPEVPKATVAMETAPDFDLLDPDNRHVRLSDWRGRNVVLVFYRGHW